MYYTLFAVTFILFFVIANPMTYKITSYIFGRWVAAADGYPTTAGVLLHAVVISLLMTVVLPMMGVKVIAK